MSIDRSDVEVAAAVEALLSAVLKSSEDLRRFYDVISKAHLNRPAPFPRTAVSTVENVIGHLSTTEQKLQELLRALGLTRAHAEGQNVKLET
jgi:hypothetical protein